MDIPAFQGGLAQFLCSRLLRWGRLHRLFRLQDWQSASWWRLLNPLPKFHIELWRPRWGKGSRHEGLGGKVRGIKVISYPESEQCHLRRLLAADRLLPLDRAMNQENRRREWLRRLQPSVRRKGWTNVDVLVRRLNTSCNTVRSKAFVGVAVGSPTPNPKKIIYHYNCVSDAQVKILPCKTALEESREAHELQNACRAFKIWYLKLCRRSMPIYYKATQTEDNLLSQFAITPTDRQE